MKIQKKHLEIIIQNDVVIKSYDYILKEKAIKEFSILSKMYEAFNGVIHNSWQYTTVKPLNLSYENTKFNITMEKASGNDLLSLTKPPIDVYYHIGVWLSIFHLRTVNAYGKPLSHGDFTLENINVNINKKCVTGYDFLTLGRANLLEYDLVTMIEGIIGKQIKNFKLPYKAVSYFMEGYLSTRSKLNHKNFKKAVNDRYNPKMKKKRSKKFRKTLLILSTINIKKRISQAHKGDA